MILENKKERLVLTLEIKKVILIRGSGKGMLRCNI